MSTYTLLIVILLICLSFKSIHIKQSYNLSGGDMRAAVFSRFDYKPQFPFMSTFTMDDPNRFSKRYNRAGPLKLIVQRPYRFYTMPLGNWGYPWTFPRPKDNHCLQFANDRCDEHLNWKKDVIHPSLCFNSVYQQCRKGIDPIFIKVANQGTYPIENDFSSLN